MGNNRTCLRKGGWWEKRSAIGVASLAMRAEFSDVLPHPMPVAELLKELDGFGCPKMQC